MGWGGERRLETAAPAEDAAEGTGVIVTDIAIQPMPPEVEICARVRNMMHCMGVIRRLPPDERPYCFVCGSNEPGITYRLHDLPR